MPAYHDTPKLSSLAAHITPSAAYFTGAWLGWNHFSEDTSLNRSDELFACNPKRLTRAELNEVPDEILVAEIQRAADYRHSWGDHEYGRILAEAGRRLNPKKASQSNSEEAQP